MNDVNIKGIGESKRQLI